MAYRDLNVRIVGVAPLLMHNGRMCNPIDPINKLMKGITSKKEKTDADYELLSDIEWLGSIYTTEPINVDSWPAEFKCPGRLCIPAEVVEGMLMRAGQRNKKKKQFQSAILVEHDSPLEFTGPKSIAELYKRPAYRDIRKVKIMGKSVMRTRCILRDWSFTVNIKYLDDVLNERAVLDALDMGGRIIGIGDYIPKFGRFMYEEIKASSVVGSDLAVSGKAR